MNEPTQPLMPDIAVLRDALDRLVASAFRKEHPNGAPFSIPANPRRDSDHLLYAALDELTRLREQLAETQSRLSDIARLRLEHEKNSIEDHNRAAAAERQLAAETARREAAEGQLAQARAAALAFIDEARGRWETDFADDIWPPPAAPTNPVGWVTFMRSRCSEETFWDMDRIADIIEAATTPAPAEPPGHTDG